MRLSTAVTLLALMAALPAGAGELKGIVYENEVGSHTVAGVVISSPGANRTITNGDGQFKLIFPNKKPGDTVQIAVEKTGYVMVNDIQLEQVLAANPDEKLMKILISTPTSREEMARRYYRLKSFDAIEANYKQLLKENQSNVVKIAHLQKERNQAIAVAEQTAEELAKTKPGQASELYNRAMRLFLDGQTEQALEVLNEEHLRRNLAAAKQRKETSEKTIEQVAESWVLKARLLTLQFKFDEADRAYQEALKAAPDSADVNFSYGHFNQDLNRFAAARRVYEYCLDVFRHNSDQVGVANTLTNLGYVHLKENRMVEARQAFEETLKIRRELAARDPDTYLPDLAVTLNNLGELHREQNRMAEARQALEEALKIFRDFASRDPDTFLPYVATALGNLGNALDNMGNLHDDQKLMLGAQQAHEEALKIRRKLALKNLNRYLPGVAETLNNLGNLYRDQNRMEEASQAFDEALKIYRELATRNPEAYLPYVAGALNNLGIFQDDQKARQTYEEALKTYRELSRKDPDAYLPYIATLLYNLGNLYGGQNEIAAARQAFEEALKTYRQLASRNPDTYLPDLAMTLNNLGALYIAQSRMTAAGQAFQEALNIYRQLTAKNPETYLGDIAATLNNLGALHGALKQMDESRQAFQEALSIYRELADKRPDTYLPLVALALNNLGNLHSGQERFAEARQAYEEALEIYERLAAKDQKRFRSDLARIKALLDRLKK